MGSSSSPEIVECGHTPPCSPARAVANSTGQAVGTRFVTSCREGHAADKAAASVAATDPGRKSGTSGESRVPVCRVTALDDAVTHGNAAWERIGEKSCLVSVERQRLATPVRTTTSSRKKRSASSTSSRRRPTLRLERPQQLRRGSPRPPGGRSTQSVTTPHEGGRPPPFSATLLPTLACEGRSSPSLASVRYAKHFVRLLTRKHWP